MNHIVQIEKQHAECGMWLVPFETQKTGFYRAFLTP